MNIALYIRGVVTSNSCWLYPPSPPPFFKLAPLYSSFYFWEDGLSGACQLMPWEWISPPLQTLLAPQVLTVFPFLSFPGLPVCRIFAPIVLFLCVVSQILLFP